MNSEPLFVLVPILLVAIVLYFTPQLTRKGLFFSATVNPDFPRSKDGRRLLRSYRWQVALWTGVTIALMLYVRWTQPDWPGIVPMVLLIVGVGFSYRRNFREVQARFGRPPSETRHARVHSPLPDTRVRLWFILLPFAALATVAVYLHLHWDNLPQRFPVHFGIEGRPNQWANRDWRGVYGPVLIG